MENNLKDALRLGMRRLASGVCVVSTRVDDTQYAMTASSVTSVSDDPASLLVCVNQEAVMQSKLTQGQPFVVNVLSQSQQEISNCCADRSKGEERFNTGNWHCNEEGMPYLLDAQAAFFCRVDNDNYMYGTHQIVIGLINQVLVANEPVDPLIYVDGKYAAI